MGILGPAGVPCSYVFDSMDLFNDPHLKSRDFIQTVEHPVVGEVKLMRNPIRMSESTVPLKHSPLLGQDTAAVLCDELGLSDEQVQKLMASGIVSEGARNSDG